MDPAEEDWEGHKEGANEISHGGTFSDAAPALPPRRTATFASWPSRPRGPSPGVARGWSVPVVGRGGRQRARGVDGHVVLLWPQGRGIGGGEDEDETSAVKAVWRQWRSDAVLADR